MSVAPFARYRRSEIDNSNPTQPYVTPPLVPWSRGNFGKVLVLPETRPMELWCGFDSLTIYFSILTQYQTDDGQTDISTATSFAMRRALKIHLILTLQWKRASSSKYTC